jgi:hypothetical protein
MSDDWSFGHNGGKVSVPSFNDRRVFGDRHSYITCSFLISSSLSELSISSAVLLLPPTFLGYQTIVTFSSTLTYFFLRSSLGVMGTHYRKKNTTPLPQPPKPKRKTIRSLCISLVA